MQILKLRTQLLSAICESPTEAEAKAAIDKALVSGEGVNKQSILPPEVVEALPTACLPALKGSKSVLAENAGSEADIASAWESWRSFCNPLDVLFQAANSSIAGIDSARRQKEKQASMEQKKMLAKAKAKKKPTKPTTTTPSIDGKFTIFKMARQSQKLTEMRMETTSTDMDDFETPYVIRRACQHISLRLSACDTRLVFFMGQGPPGLTGPL